MKSRSEYKRLRENARNLYSSVNEIYSPALSKTIFFTSEGFNHILYRSKRSERDRKSQLVRFRHLPSAIRLIMYANTFQEYEERLLPFEIEIDGIKEWKNENVKYWGIIAIFEGGKIKVVLRQVGDGDIHFWSIIPAWITSKSRDAKLTSTIKGNSEED